MNKNDTNGFPRCGAHSSHKMMIYGSFGFTALSGAVLWIGVTLANSSTYGAACTAQALADKNEKRMEKYAENIVKIREDLAEIKTILHKGEK